MTDFFYAIVYGIFDAISAYGIADSFDLLVFPLFPDILVFLLSASFGFTLLRFVFDFISRGFYDFD